jgi:indole-3-glycerol phosphate synthase
MAVNALELMTWAVSQAEAEEMICKSRSAGTPVMVACPMNAHMHRIVDLQAGLLVD